MITFDLNAQGPDGQGWELRDNVATRLDQICTMLANVLEADTSVIPDNVRVQVKLWADTITQPNYTTGYVERYTGPQQYMELTVTVTEPTGAPPPPDPVAQLHESTRELMGEHPDPDPDPF